MYPHQNNYTNEMIYYAHKDDVEKFRSLIEKEGPRNKKNRQDIEIFFQKFLNNVSTIDIYRQRYEHNDLSQFTGYDMEKIIKDHIAVGQLMLRQGYKHDFNLWGPDKKTILHKAVIEDDFKYVKALLSLDHSLVNPNVQDGDSLTPYDYAKDPQIKELLSKHASFLGKHKKLRKILNGFALIMGIALLGLSSLSPVFCYNAR